MNKTEKHIVPELLHPIRLQEYGVGIFNSALTKSALKKAIKKELITVNGVLASTATFIKGGETIKISVPEIKKAKKELIFPLPVLYEDEYLAAIHKPAGILVSGNSFKTIANALPQNLKKSTLIDAAIPQPVHRLDYPTTGILLTGKTSNSIRILNKLFEDKKIQKTYFAITIGKMDSKGVITATIDGKKSKSKYKVLKTVPSKRFGNLNLVKLKPKTGRKHQLRIHLASIGNPILGDKEYGKEDLILNGKGIYLHAYSLKFTHPFTQQKLCLKNELPERFRKVIG
ncbi:RluA family pseudouridine synthase [Joostella atrarenae]|uniref:RluA family pseudouridine synthase n=1 Tax=Joostella atrarenae TaxID=679257 RepID=A0ABS9J018_9FLAO|nr:RluA family pseudouridine synthase [Joostella atrarenae]MCF8713698.1 RluA family pseudouridine synthase [Joostella atrarenae]